MGFLKKTDMPLLSVQMTKSKNSRVMNAPVASPENNEIMFINDGSSDGTRGVIRRLES